MYLARFENASERWLQGVADLAALPSPASPQSEPYWSNLRRIVRSCPMAGCGRALRVTSDGRGLRRTTLALAAGAEERGLRKYLASFARLERFVAGSVELPASAQQHDGMLAPFPALRCRPAATGFRAGGVWFACDFRVGAFLDDLLVEASSQGHALGYQVNVRSMPVARECCREAARNALRVRSTPGVPAEVARMQQRLADALTGATAVFEEILGVETDEAADWLAAALRRHFARAYRALKFEEPDFRFIDRGFEENLALGAHSSHFGELPADEVCGSAVGAEAEADLLAWRPSADLLGHLSAAAPAGRQEPVEHVAPVPAEMTRTLPAPWEGDGDYLFISYKHADMDRVAPVLRMLDRAGHRIWYDHGIPGGSEWDNVLEDRVTRCKALLLFVSPAAVASKYVRREVKFADAMDRPVLGIFLEDTQLSHGMGMLLTQYQMIHVRAPDFAEKIERALRYVGAKAAGA